VAVANAWEAARLLEDEDALPGPQRKMLTRLFQTYHALLAVPLIVQGEGDGAITLYYRQPREFSDEELRLAMSVADQAALAIESARLRAQAEQAAAVAERSRLARELHDSVTQNLYSVTLYAEAAARCLTGGEASQAAEYLRELRDTSQEALREMRLLIFELRPLALEKSGLIAALQARLDAVEVRSGTQAELRVESEEVAERLPYSVQQELYHITQEALNNVLKHARAQHVWVYFRFEPDLTCLEVRDDGVGFDQALVGEGGGLGLKNLWERAARLNAVLQIDSAPGQGTTVTVTVPGKPAT
jgi:signal transduction histidine kinase